jgi:hypothetical protein
MLTDMEPGADHQAVRDRVQELMASSRRPWTTNQLWRGLREVCGGNPPVGRSTVYRWFEGQMSVSPQIIALIPALAQLFEVSPYELYEAGGLLPPDTAAATALAGAAQNLTMAAESAARALAGRGVPIASEALVVGQILQRNLDYRLTVWPVVRGASTPMHLRSWVAVQPVTPTGGQQRSPTTGMAELTVEDRRRRIRYDIIGDPLWRSVGARWRDPVPMEWPYPKDKPDLLIEIPKLERDQVPQSPEPVQPGAPTRILVLAPLWGHAEPLASLMAGVLHWGTYDLRYQGFSDPAWEEAKLGFSREKLRERTPYYVWSLAESAEFLSQIDQDVVEAAARHLVVHVRYEETFARSAARAFGVSPKKIRSSQAMVDDIAARINARHSVIRVDYADRDFQAGPSGRRNPEIDRNQLLDHVRYTAADILTMLYADRGAKVAEWGSNFEDVANNRWRKGAHGRGTSVRRLRPGVR